MRETVELFKRIGRDIENSEDALLRQILSIVEDEARREHVLRHLEKQREKTRTPVTDRSLLARRMMS